MAEKPKAAINQAAAQMGRRGGKSGKGVSKRRGNISYYRDMQRKSVASRLRNSVGSEKKPNSK
ncbi:MAG TPA: hypothetical protein DCL00_07910 [Opitutae bacterium]|jgi:hypothetical protein|nr:hypothetical protein [Opitutae bacterium]HAF59498.1 hypothetical protein [Opitutae bacterium]|tara:strand:+ start:1582 stop:1770 length:189 start_codon:yes stop_codon:yes gene_type:complete